MKPLTFAVAAVLAFSCGSSTSSGGGGGGGGQQSTGGGGQDAGLIADPCGTICTKLDSCNPSDGGVATCTASCQTLVMPFRDDYTQALARCNRDTACADLFMTTSNCVDGGGACSSQTVNTCLATAGTMISDSVLEGFYDGGVCQHLIACGTVASDSACRSAFTALADFPALKAYPDQAISCTGSCMAAAMCSTLASAMLDSALNDCASKTCGIHLTK